MFYGKSKRVIVIRDIHSNLFEEAILVLKEDKENDNTNSNAQSADKIAGEKNDFILKEAEQVINNYIRNHKKTLPPVKKRGRRVKDYRFVKNLIINSALAGSIVAVLFLLFKLI